MTGCLTARIIRIFDYQDFAKAVLDRGRDGAVSPVAKAGATIEHISRPHICKKGVVARVLERRGDRSGSYHLGHGVCDGYKAGRTSQTHKTFVQPDRGKCLHYYSYFLDVTFGLLHLRVPT